MDNDKELPNKANKAGSLDLGSIFEKALGDISGGKVLDAATGDGGFIGVLKENLKDYTEIIGIDIEKPSSDYAKDIFAQENMRFIQMDAERIDLEDESFDTVNISASLHHLAKVPQVLSEMYRVLKPGGHFIVTEMHKDGITEAQLTVIFLHQWAAEADTAVGIVHNKTLARQEIIGLVGDLKLNNLDLYEFYDLDSDPMDEKGFKQLEEYVDKRVNRVKGLPNYRSLKKKAEKLLRRLYKTGRQREPVIIIIGEK